MAQTVKKGCNNKSVLEPIAQQMHVDEIGMAAHTEVPILNMVAVKTSARNYNGPPFKFRNIGALNTLARKFSNHLLLDSPLDQFGQFSPVGLLATQKLRLGLAWMRAGVVGGREGLHDFDGGLMHLIPQTYQNSLFIHEFN